MKGIPFFLSIEGIRKWVPFLGKNGIVKKGKGLGLRAEPHHIRLC